MSQYDELDKIGFVGTGKHDRKMDRVVTEYIRKRKEKGLDPENNPKVVIQDEAL